MNILTLLVAFFLISSLITLATDVAGKLLQIIVNIIGILIQRIRTAIIGSFYTREVPKVQKIKLIIAFIMTMFAILAFNQGILTTLEVPIEQSYEWFHEVDIWITIIALTGGASVIHKLQEAANKYYKMMAIADKMEEDNGL